MPSRPSGPSPMFGTRTLPKNAAYALAAERKQERRHAILTICSTLSTEGVEVVRSILAMLDLDPRDGKLD